MNEKLKPSGTPASRRSRFASARDFSMSREYPASFSSSACGVANGVPGTCTPPTSFTIVIRDNACAPWYRSSASVSARRARLSSHGFFSWLVVTSRMQSHGLSCTTTFLPSELTMLSRSGGETPRNWTCARSARSPPTCAEASRT